MFAYFLMINSEIKLKYNSDQINLTFRSMSHYL